MRSGWLRGCTFRQFRKRACWVHWDGVAYKPRVYGRMVADARKLRPGDPIFNPYKQQWDTVKEIQSQWEDRGWCRIYRPLILTVTGYLVYDCHEEQRNGSNA